MSHTDALVAFLAAATLERDEIDRFLDPAFPAWARFDPELGYLPNDAWVPDNIDGALSQYRYGRFGERLQINYAGEPSRINTYGDSFTQGHQVSDGETWQEALAAHFTEPIRNFGVGGYGVYQAIRRLQRIEKGDGSAPFLVLNIYLDDHFRSLDAYRLLRLGNWWRDYDRSLNTSMFHANPWAHVRVDPSTGAIDTRDNVCVTPESLYNLCDTEFLLDQFGDDFVVGKLVADQTGDYGYLTEYENLAATLEIRFDPTNAGRETAHSLWESSAFSATESLLHSLHVQTTEAGKRLLVLLTYPAEVVADFLSGGQRVDRAVIESLSRLGIPYVDGLELHANDYRDFSISPAAYTRRYYAGHYTPLGNTHFAFMIKQAFVEWLDPPPPAYAHADQSFARQAGRLA